MPHVSYQFGIVIILLVRGPHTSIFWGFVKKTLVSFCLWEVWSSSLGPAIRELGVSLVRAGHVSRERVAAQDPESLMCPAEWWELWGSQPSRLVSLSAAGQWWRHTTRWFSSVPTAERSMKVLQHCLTGSGYVFHATWQPGKASRKLHCVIRPA